MKSVSPALKTWLAGVIAGHNPVAITSDCFTITLRSGTVLRYTNSDVACTLGGNVFSATSLKISGMKYKASVGLDVDHQQISISATDQNTLAGVPMLRAIANGAWDGAAFTRERAWLSAWGAAPIGSVLLFSGRIGTIDSVGRTLAQITVDALTVLLDIQIPRNRYSPACVHVLFDSGCALSKAAFSTAGTALAGSQRALVIWSGSSAAYAQGTLVFTSGANAGITVTVKSGSGTSLALAYPLPAAPAPGDAFTVTMGCDHTRATCISKFANGANFRGFDLVPATTTAF